MPRPTPHRTVGDSAWDSGRLKWCIHGDLRTTPGKKDWNMRAFVTVSTGGVPRVLRAGAAVVQEPVALAVYRTGAMYRTRVRAHASGRPGPRVITGDYRRSISQTNTKQGSVAVALVHTNRPQAARLEYGFVGRDVLGRYYNQPPYPHWAPAAKGMQESLEAQIRIALNGSLGRVWRTP